jgi:hypothetical protein
MRYLVRSQRYVAATQRANVFPLRIIFVIAVTLLGAGVKASGQEFAPTLRDIVGVNNPVGRDMAEELGIGWIRFDVSWRTAEVQQGKLDWSRSDSLMKAALAAGDQVLPMLGYTPPWSETIKSQGQAPPKKPHDWALFVEAAVSRYSAPPYNVRYFQIWNEPTRKAGFWLGTNEQYIDMVYIPAAKIIRQHNCFVVFGGWPQSNSAQELDSVLNYHNAWQWTDIVDLHYHPNADVQHEYSEWVASGKCRGIWQTEIGYNTDPEFALSAYSWILHWGLQVGWRDPNEFRYFWYPGEASGGDAEKALIKAGTGVLTDNGKHLATLNQVLGLGPVRLFTEFSTDLPANVPGRGFGVNGFEVGSNRRVLELVVNRTVAKAHPSISVSAAMRGNPLKVQLISGFGKTWELPFQYGGGRVHVSVPLRPDIDDCTTCHYIFCYLVLEL